MVKVKLIKRLWHQSIALAKIIAACVKGVCSAKYLGGDLPVSINRCVCEEGWYKTFNLKKIKINKFLY